MPKHSTLHTQPAYLHQTCNAELQHVLDIKVVLAPTTFSFSPARPLRCTNQKLFLTQFFLLSLSNPTQAVKTQGMRQDHSPSSSKGSCKLARNTRIQLGGLPGGCFSLWGRWQVGGGFPLQAGMDT